jgi:hypothetical protein
MGRGFVAALTVASLYTVSRGVERQPTRPVGEPRTCSNATLKGGYAVSTTAGASPDVKHITAVGKMVFDGKDGWRASYAAAVSGEYVSEKLEGHYSIGDDCSGTMTGESTSGHMRYWIVTDTAGREIRLLHGPAARAGVMSGFRQGTE